MDNPRTLVQTKRHIPWKLLPVVVAAVGATYLIYVINFPARPHRIGESDMDFPVKKSDAEWKKQLTPEQYHVAREKGTERPFMGAYWDTTDEGTYRCIGCGEPLFMSDSKFDAHCGWPSFDKPMPGTIHEETDGSHFVERTEVVCKKCGAHLGHVFDDGPTATGLRYCINSASLKLEKKDHKGE